MLMPRAVRRIRIWVPVGTSLGGLVMVLVDLACDESFEASHDVFAGLAFGKASSDVGAGWWVVAHAHEHDREQGVVGSPVAVGVETVTDGLADEAGMRTGAAEFGEGCIGVESVGVVAGGGEELCGDVGADTGQAEQRWCVCRRHVA